MKIYLLLIVVSLLSLIVCLNEDTQCDTQTASSRGDCTSRKFSEDELKKNAKYCCLVETTILGTKGKSCLPIDQASYDDIKKFIDDLKEKTGATELSIDCSSKYLKYSLLILLLSIL